MKFAVISTSLDPQSRSAKLCELAAKQLKITGHEVIALNLQTSPLPPFDNDACYTHPNYKVYHEAIKEADGILLGVPVYNWGVGSSAKALVEITGSTDRGRRLESAWFDKPVTFLVAGGLEQGYVSHGSFALGLMFDFKCVINPHFVHAISSHWNDDGQPRQWLLDRLERTVNRAIDFSERLEGRPYQSVWEI